MSKKIVMNLTSYNCLIGNGFKAKLEVLTQLIGNNHHPSIGQYKEKLLRNFLKNMLPKRFDVGTGFILFPSNEYDVNSNNGSHNLSKQLDIIIYNSLDYSPIFKDENFVIVKPESVLIIIEIKGKVTKTGIKKCINSFSDLAKKWQRCSEFYKEEEINTLINPDLYLLCWDANPSINGEKLRNYIVEYYKEYVSVESDLIKPSFPILSSAFLYSDCIVDLMEDYQTYRLPCFGFYTRAGKYKVDSKDKKTKFQEVGDKTISILIALIQLRLEKKYNRPVSAPQQSQFFQDEEYEFTGFTEWLTPEETKKVRDISIF